MKSLFHKKIKCMHCGGNFKARKDRGKTIYICSKYSNYGLCKRIPMYEDFLKEIIERRQQSEMSGEEIKEIVIHIEVENKMLFKIYLKDQEPIVFEENRIIY